MISKFDEEYRWLSNFWPARVMFDGQVYPTVEHAYVASKTLDINIRSKIRVLATAGMAKSLGRKLAIRPDWNEVRLGIMEDLVRKKFQHENLAELLLTTGKQHLQEGNHWGDTFWGVCKGKGNNHLGKILMKIRDELNT